MSRSRADERQQRVAEAHFASVWRFLRALGVPAGALDDAAQEVFLVVARKLERIRPEAERSFLFSTAVHVSRELRRKHAREELAQDPDDEALEPSDGWTPEASLDRKEERDLLMHLLHGLTEELRTAFVLYEIEGHSVTEIAAMLDVPSGTVASRLRRAREKVELRLQKLQMTMRGER
ncbi:MAG: RNA polymerase sigma factor [Labilithrix sp.]|nr:RNA polymerase sigma factor [Labilithrix sp.]